MAGHPVLAVEIGITFVTLVLGELVASRVRPWIWVAGAVIAFSYAGLVWRRNRIAPDFERVERRTEKGGVVTIDWEEHSKGRSITIHAPIAEAVASMGTETDVLTYDAECEFSEGYWWLTLILPDDAVVGVRVTVTDPLGGGARKEFGQPGPRIIVRYPEDFELPGVGGTKQPWGLYHVEWEVYRLTDGGTKGLLDGKARCEFQWKSFGNF